MSTLTNNLPTSPVVSQKSTNELTTEQGTSPVIESAQDALAGSKIWTVKEFKWGNRNPFTTVFKRGNDYVTEQWSEEYFIACKTDIGLLKNSLKNILKSFGKCEIWKAGAHLINAVAIGILLVVNIEGANFVKGILGMCVSLGKIPVHVLFALSYLLAAFVMLIVCNPEQAGKCFKEMAAQFGFVLKDFISVITCLGHSIPSWLPALLVPICPPIAIALFAVKLASKFTGSFDLLAYGGTATLLYTKAKTAEIAKRALRENEPLSEEVQKDIETWEKLKRELHPCKSTEGAVLTLYALNVLREGALTLVDFFLPGVGTIVKYGTYGVLGTAAVGLGVANYKNHRNEEETVPAEVA
jgi:hypothetical protein